MMDSVNARGTRGWLRRAGGSVLLAGAVIFAGCGEDDPGGSAEADAGETSPDGGSSDGVDGSTPPEDGGPPPRTDLCEGIAAPGPYPTPDAYPANDGPGGPTTTFTEDDLYENCAFLDGGPDDPDHHNLVVMYDGYLLMPWAHEAGGIANYTGGITLWDIRDPCNPVRHGGGTSETMRESHSIGFMHHDGRRWAVTDMATFEDRRVQGGIQFWDMDDSAAPVAVTDMALPGFGYPDAYARVVLSVFWQAPYVYAAGADNGIYVIDASNPTNPILVDTYAFEPTLRAGQVHAIGNLLVVTETESSRVALVDISDPEAPMPIPGGEFDIREGGDGDRLDAYFSNLAGGYTWHARKEGGGGLIVYDIRDPSAPTFAGDIRTRGDGGYVFVKDGYAFVGQSNRAVLYDVSDLENIEELADFDLEGDLDTITPIGNIVVLSVDDDANDDEASVVAPWQTEPDTAAPTVTWVHPDDGAENLPLTSRIGVTFSEMVDPSSAWEGSVRLYQTGTEPDETRVPGIVSAQELVVNFHPLCPLEPDTEYTLEIPAGGIVDHNGNAIAEPFVASFRTGS